MYDAPNRNFWNFIDKIYILTVKHFVQNRSLSNLIDEKTFFHLEN